jgi:outer membrane biosynthesis protein TonB
MGEAAHNRAPAWTASALLHAGLLASVLFVWPWSKPIKLSSVVPVTLVTSDQASEPSEAVAAPTPQTAATETPEPTAKPQAAAPEPTPLPVPAPPPVKQAQAKPAPAPAPAKQAVKPTPTPTPTKTPAKPMDSSFDPDAVLASLTKSAKASGARQSSARRGPTQATTAVQARMTTGAGDTASASALTSLAATLQRLWNPNCDVPGAGDLDIRVTFRLRPGGRLDGLPQSTGDNAPDGSLLGVASDRAKRAVYAAQPFEGLPSNVYGQPITVKFNGKAACSGGSGLG